MGWCERYAIFGKEIPCGCQGAVRDKGMVSAAVGSMLCFSIPLMGHRDRACGVCEGCKWKAAGSSAFQHKLVEVHC